jgi:putative addiction module component (TIGR02574 family)
MRVAVLFLYTSAMAATLLDQAKILPPAERLELIGELWDTLDQSEIPVTTEERRILGARIADIESDPDAQETWSDAREWLESRRR